MMQRVHGRLEGEKRNAARSRIEGRVSNTFDRSEDIRTN